MRTNNKLVALGFIIWALTALCSCSIKEDRSDCPCYLEIDMSNLVAKEVTLRGQGQRILFTEQFPARAFREFHEYLVPGDKSACPPSATPAIWLCPEMPFVSWKDGRWTACLQEARSWIPGARRPGKSCG